jgi:hypothetical protein
MVIAYSVFARKILRIANNSFSRRTSGSQSLFPANTFGCRTIGNLDKVKICGPQ